jgi:hypothetical protein
MTYDLEVQLERSPTYPRNLGLFFSVEGKVYSSTLKIERRYLPKASASFLLSLPFDHEDRFDMFLRNVKLFPN